MLTVALSRACCRPRRFRGWARRASSGEWRDTLSLEHNVCYNASNHWSAVIGWSADGGNATAADDEVSFTPIEYGIANGLLPGYLSSAIDFEKRELPGFVGRMLAVLNQVVAQRGAGH